MKTGIHPWREHLSKVPDAIECEHVPTQVGYDDELQSGWDPDEDDEHADELPWDVSDSLCRNSLVMQTDCCSSCPGGWSQTILEVKMLDVEVLGWCGYTWSAVVRLVGCTAKFSETPLETAYVREMNIQFTSNSSGGHSCSQHANCTLPQNLRHLWHCAVIKLHILEWPFIVDSLRHTCAIIMLSNQHLDVPHLWGGWIISAKEKCSLTQI